MDLRRVAVLAVLLVIFLGGFTLVFLYIASEIGLADVDFFTFPADNPYPPPIPTLTPVPTPRPFFEGQSLQDRLFERVETAFAALGLE